MNAQEARQEKLADFSWPVLLSNFFSVFGEGVYRFGLNWFIVSTYGDARLLGWLTAFGFIVYLANDMYVGAVLDRFDRKKVLVVADLFGGIGLLILSMFLNPDSPQLVILFALTFIMNVDISYAYPAGRAVLPDVIKSRSIPRFNAFVSAAFSAGQALGPLVGGVLLHLHWINLQSFMILYGLMVVLTAVINMAIKTVPEEKEETDPQPFIESLIDGYRYVARKPKLFESMLLTVWGNFCFEGFIISMPFLIQRVYGGSATDYSTALTVAAVSGIAAGLFLAHKPTWNKIRTLYWDFYILGVVFLIAAFVNTLWALVIVIIVNGLMRASFVIKINTVRQEDSAPEYLGRVFGISFFATDLFVPVITITFGYAISAVGSWILLILGIMLLAGFAIIRLYCRHRETKLGLV